MKRKKTTHIKAADPDRARRLRHRAACVRYRLRRKVGVRLNKPRVSEEELEYRMYGAGWQLNA